MMRVVFFGMGYCAQASAAALRAEDPTIDIAGTVRNAGKALPGYGIRSFEDASVLAGASHVIASIPPDAEGDPVLRLYRKTLLDTPTLQWLCYYSTIGVYGDSGGAWIDETAPCQPQSARARQRLDAEEGWRALAEERGIPLMIARLGGIYGPGRSSFERLRAGRAERIVKPGQVFNRIHVADIARITVLAARLRLSGTFNLCDDEPSPPQDVITYAAGLIGVEPPPEVAFEDAQMSELARSFYTDNKRVSNAAIKAALGIDLLYPNYREGLSAIAD